VKHYGDVTKINGAEVPEVDVITFGAPCQDLSVAGKRAGMKNVIMGDEETTRSGLFFEAIRIIKEMRDESRRKHGGSDECIRPRFAVYENVCGAFSSNKGEDFRAVLEETARVADKDAVIPGPPKGKWTPAGCIMADGWSIAWRVHDAQFWGVPQRRKRISLVADFAGGALQKYYLSEKACLGILRRAERRGKVLPPMLDQALRKQAGL
jgi:DNA (cytosine-5)-methyltransferase 1